MYAMTAKCVVTSEPGSGFGVSNGLIPDLRNTALNDPALSPSLQSIRSQNGNISGGSHSPRPGAYELKFLLPLESAEGLLEEVNKSLTWDSHGTEPAAQGLIGSGYWIESLYTDTPEWSVYHRQPGFGQRKYRIRRYGDSDWVFLERKRKRQGLVTKRRTQIDLSGSAWLGSEEWPDTFAEHAWFHRRLRMRSLNAVARVRYFRRALMGVGQFGTIRVTVDTHLSCRATCSFDWVGSERNGHPLSVPLMDDHAIVEFKFAVVVPHQFRTWIDAFGLNRTSCSKYRTAVDTLELRTQGAGGDSNAL